MKLGGSQSPVQSDDAVNIHPSRAPFLPLERRITETAYWLHLSKAKVLPAASCSGSGVKAPAENFLMAAGEGG